MPRAPMLALPILVCSLTAAEADPRRFSALQTGGFANAGERGAGVTTSARRFESLRTLGDSRFATLSVPFAIEAAPSARDVRVERKLRPLSVSPVDPNAVVSKTSSGRIFISPAPGAYIATPGEVAYYKRLSQPYAPPSFQMIGEGAGQNMGAPVKLTYGVQPRRGFNPGPKVVWLDGRDAAAAEDEPARNPHVHYMK